jgi:hypothetical protein
LFIGEKTGGKTLSTGGEILIFPTGNATDISE